MLTIRTLAKMCDLDATGPLEQVALRIVEAARGHHPGRLPDFYGLAAKAVGATREQLLSSRSKRHVAARHGVWRTLRARGWSYNEIGSASCLDRRWNHSTVMSGIARLAGAGEAVQGWAGAAGAAVDRVLDERAEG